MAPNKFATVLNRETNRITIVLVYAVLEWTLIIFLLLNSLFSYLIIKFANYFGLKPPCLLCSRLDHIFEPPNSKPSYRDLICENHAIELSRSGYCSNHRKLVESQDMCEDCWSSHHEDHHHPTTVMAFRWLKEIGMVKSDDDCKVVENCDVNLSCSCCGVYIKNEILAPLTPIKPSLGFLEVNEKFTGDELLEDTEKANTDEFLPRDVKFHADTDGKDEGGNERSRDIQMGSYNSDLIREDDNLEGYSFCLSKEGYALVEAHKEVVLEAETEPLLISSSVPVSYSYADEKIIPQHLEFYIDFDDYQLIPVDLEMEKSKGEKNRDQEKFNELWRETDEGLVLEPDAMVAPAALDAVEKITSSLDFLELYETKSEEKQTSLQEADEAKVEALAIQKDQEEAEEMKTEVGDVLIVNEHKVEILPTVKGQVEVTTKEIDFHVISDDKCDVLPTSNGDQLTEEIQVTELNANIPTSDFEDVFHKQIPDETKVDGLAIQIEQETEDVKREVGSVLIIDEHKVEILPTIKTQVEVTTKDIDFHVVGDEKWDVTEEMEVTELNTNIPTPDFEDVCHKENDLIDIVRSIESKDKSEVSESLRPWEDECPSSNDDAICEASTITNDLYQVTDHEPVETEDAQIQEDMTVEITERELQCDVALSHEPNELELDSFPETNGLHEIRDYEIMQTEETHIHTDITAETTERQLQIEVPLCHDPNKLEVDSFPETPKPTDSLHHLHKEILEESSANVLNNGEGTVRVEELNAQLESERKILRALYAELEEERSAAAIATNETMAMINRLQEEKSTIEMEALQYQRMMEEQCEYDQEALQLMNEMLVKREKQLQELEKELEICNKKVIEYEEREKLRLLSHRKDKSCTKSRTSSVSCSNGEESDDLSVDLNHEVEGNGHHHNTPVDAILDLQDPLGSFEEERMSILEQLKVLEEKLCTLAEEEKHHIGDMKPFEQFYEENANEFDKSFKLNGDANGHEEKCINGSKPKQLLPLFDAAAETDSDSEISNHKAVPTKFELERKRVEVEEEVEHLYERLHALEADREFVKHCVGSLRKGDKGLNLLQEILQHLRDLKDLELQARNVGAVS